MYGADLVHLALLDRDFNFDVIIGIPAEQVGVFMVFKKHRTYGTQVFLIKSAAFHFRQASECLISASALFYRHCSRHFGSRGISAFRIGKYVQIGNIEVLDKAVGFQKICLGFAGEAHDHIAADAGVWHVFFDGCNPFGV